jgi:two-component system nitrogen regulation response regulator GlnG
LLERYHWPGNVRELQSVLKQAILQATGPVVVPEFLPEYVRGKDAAPAAAVKTDFPDLQRYIQARLSVVQSDLYADFQAATERVLFLEVLNRTGNNLTQAAKILGISRATLRNRLGVLGISVERVASIEDENS